LFVHIALTLPISQKDEEPDFEMSEIQMYHVNVLEEAGDIKKALNFLEDQKARILDKTGWKEKRGEIKC